MISATQKFVLQLLGPFNLLDPDGRRIAIQSRKGTALIAMLALSKNGERSRHWLQDQLWGSRQPKEANGSLRRELTELRRRLNAREPALLVCERDRVRLDLALVDIDALRLAGREESGPSPQLLEGLDIPGEDGFEEWLREHRAARSARPASAEAAAEARTAPAEEGAAPFTQPTLAVLRIQNLTGDADCAYLAAVAAQELLSQLSRLRWLSVISGLHSGEGDPPAPAHARYLLDGGLRKIGADFALDVTLWEAGRGRALWSRRALLASPSLATAVDDGLREVVAQMAAIIDHDEQKAARDKPRLDPTVGELIWRGRWHLTRLTREDNERARALFDEALALSPNSSEALINATHALAWRIWSGRLGRERIVEMRALAQRAMSADPDDGRGFWLAGTAETWLANTRAALDLLGQAVELTPSLALAHAQLGSAHNLAGRPEQARAPLELARRLSPYDAHLFFVYGELAMSALLRGEYEAALADAERSIARRRAYWYAHMIRIHLLARMGRLDEAGEARADLLNLRPRFSRSYIEWIPFVDRGLIGMFADSVLADAKAPVHAGPQPLID